MDLELGGDVGGDDLGGKAPRGLVRAAVDHRAVDDQADPLGPAEVEMGADGGLEPGPGPRGWSNTAVSETSSWAIENDQSKPALRSSLVSGLGTTASMRLSRPRRWPEPRRAHMRWARPGSSTEHRPLSRALKPTPALASCALAHSWPLAQHQSPYGA